MSSQEPNNNQSATLHRPPSPLYKELKRKGRIFPARPGILEIDYNTGLFGIEFPTGGEDSIETELTRTSKHFPLAGVEKFQQPSQDNTETGCKVFYFDTSNAKARGSGDLYFVQASGHKRTNSVKIRLEVE
ncbi:hypothetical protein IJT93_01355 [bacterium]|nr:hypothetical protein [bacterium]